MKYFLVIMLAIGLVGCGSTNTDSSSSLTDTYNARWHLVQQGESLDAILAAYNAAFREEGLKGHVTQTQVVLANPGM